MLNSEFVHEKWDPALIKSLLGCMKPHGGGACFRIDLLTKSHEAAKGQLESLAGKAGLTIKTEREPWFGLEALVIEVSDSITRSWASSSTSTPMHLPPVNPYVATDFELKANDAYVEAERIRAVEIQGALKLPALLSTPPVLISNEPGLRVW